MVQKRLVVLFADHDVAWSEGVRAELQARGARVFTAKSAAEMQEKARLWQPDLAVIGADLSSDRPEALVLSLRSVSPHARIVLLESPSPDGLEILSRAPSVVYQGQRPGDPHMLMEIVHSEFPDRLVPAARGPRQPALVMCVDDDPLYLRSLDRLLTQHGYRVVGFESPERALESVPEIRPDMAILDIMMPGLNGLNLAEEIREGFGGRIPVVLLTARGSDEDILDGYRRGAAYYITKPCAPTTILNIVDYLVGGLEKSQRDRIEMEL